MHDFLAAYVAAGARRIRTSTDPSQRRVEPVSSRIDGSQHIGEAHAARVMEVQREFDAWPPFDELRREPCDLLRVGHPRRVAQRDALRAGLIDEALRPREHGGLGNIAFHRASECAGQRNIDRQAGVACEGGNLH